MREAALVILVTPVEMSEDRLMSRQSDGEIEQWTDRDEWMGGWAVFKGTRLAPKHREIEILSLNQRNGYCNGILKLANSPGISF